MMQTEERLLSIDYGSKRIGLALSDPLKIFAYPFKTIPNDASLFDSLKKILSEQKVSEIVVGYPLREDGSRNETTEAVEKFITQLRTITNLKIILRDERYSSSIASEKIIESVNKKMKRRDKGLVDRNAAAVILQEYLDEVKHNRLNHD